jgi:spoIIIJ-associated protein
MDSQDFLNSLFKSFKFDLQAAEMKTSEGILYDIRGDDARLLLAENGELLDALEHILFQVYGRDLPREQRFICDAEGYRQTRRAELQAMARFAADNVRKNGKPFTFGVLNSSERRTIHMSLAEEPDLETESVGEGKNRRLQIRLKEIHD